ncbi:MAG: hypothetical protein L6Q49_07120 [Anaerolineales bacterium]|nr:MAG: hypothetical protein EDM79_08695 [Chloroflexota bacterium]MCK6582851.1 hypothetical protein [Anaerolineales bacterium]
MNARMSVHAAMTSDTSTSSYSPGFLRRLVGCLMFVLMIAGFIALIQRYQDNLTPFLMIIFAVLAVGLASGSAPRASFYDRPGWISFLVMLILLPIGMLALGFFTNWQIGIGPLEPWLDGVLDHEQIAQLGSALIVAVISLAAWRRKPPKIGRESFVSHQSVNMRDSVKVPVPARSNGNIRLLRGRASNAPISARIGNLFPRIKSLPGFRWGRRDRPVSLSFKNKGSRLGYQRSRRKPNVQVSLYEVHRCPYCLEEVKLTDPRGVKKCEICNTVHHADCWDVTGECQVPHLNTL